jgi:hypothetical protein
MYVQHVLVCFCLELIFSGAIFFYTVELKAEPFSKCSGYPANVNMFLYCCESMKIG